MANALSGLPIAVAVSALSVRRLNIMNERQDSFSDTYPFSNDRTARDKIKMEMSVAQEQ